MRKTFGLIVVLAALVGLTTSATAGIIYSQAEHHILTNGSWYLFKNWDTFTSQISAQHFGPCHDGVVKEISIGGGFEIFEGDLLPDALIVEIWEPIAPDRSPFILLGQWITPVGNIIYESDAEGFPLLTVDVSDAQLQLLHGYDYCIAAYSDGDDLHPLSWTIDMSHGNGAFWISNDNTITWAGTYWFGNPEDGNPAAAFEFGLYGVTGTVEELVTPPVGVWGRYDSANADRPFFCAGWNWFSVPCPPDLGWEDPANWNGFTYALLENNLYRWENRTTELYDADFDTVEGYRGYVLRLDDDLGDVSFLGRCACCPTVEITLIGGWNWFGVPVTCNQDAVKVRNDQTGEVRTAAVDDAAGANRWLNWNWSFYDSAARTVRLVYFGGGSDDTMLREWFGYRTMVDTLDPGQTYTLIVPAE